jgi:hypothetical protein
VSGTFFFIQYQYVPSYEWVDLLTKYGSRPEAEKQAAHFKTTYPQNEYRVVKEIPEHVLNWRAACT